MKNLLFLFLVSLVLFSCNEEMVEMLEVKVPPGNKTVLIEDFTGVGCPNCPKGARSIENLKSVYGEDRIISVAVYSRFLNDPYPTSEYNFNTDKAQSLQEYLGTLLAKPSASINRKLSDQNDRFYLLPEQWPDPVKQELERPTEVNVSLELIYDENTRTVSGEFNVVPIDDINELLHCTILITESHIIDPQLDEASQGGLILDYEHNHVMRDIITATEGDMLGSEFIKSGIYTKSFSFTIPPEDGWWVAENCEIVAFVHLADGTARRVLQAVSAHVVE